MLEELNTPTALIGTDELFKRTLAETVGERGISIDHLFELPQGFTLLQEEHLKALREFEPALVVVDLEVDPVMGVKFAQFLLEQNPALKVIGVGPMLSPELLLNALRAGFSEYLPKPITPTSLGAALDGLARKLRRNPNTQSQPGELLAIFGPKGGSGSTAIATNLAVHLHRLTGKRTLLVDLDLELGEIALQLGVEPRFSFIDMVRNFHRMDAELLASYIERHESGVHLLSAPYHPSRGELVSGEEISRILSFLKSHYRYIVVDTSKSFSPSTMAALDQADQIYLVTVADLPSLRNISRCLPILRRIAPEENRVRLVVNRFQEGSLIGTKDVERTLGIPVYGTLANDYAAVMDSINTGSPVILNNTSSFGSDVRRLGAEIAGLRSSQDRPQAGVLQRILNPFRRAPKQKAEPAQVPSSAESSTRTIPLEPRGIRAVPEPLVARAR
jgi:pilus assembly protein CpaE